MKKNSLQFIVYVLQLMLICISIAGCHKNNDWKESPSGLRYIFFEDKQGNKAQVGDGLQMHLIYKNGADSVLFDSKVLGKDFSLQLTEPPFKGSLEEGFAMMSEGDSAAFMVSADSVYKNVFHQVMPKQMANGTRLRIDVRMNKILTPNEYKSSLNEGEKKNVMDEPAQIKSYLESNQITAMKDTNGIYFISFVEGNGRQPKQGDNVEASYMVRSLNGELFDSSDKNFKFTLGDSSMVQGWNMGIAMMKQGGKARFIIPSKLGYGNKQYGKIPPNTPLVFDVDLIKAE